MKDDSQNPSRRRRPATEGETYLPADPAATPAAASRRRRRPVPEATAAADPAAREGDARKMSPDSAARERSRGTSSNVGYRRPPESGQFKPGQSGNPAGRPKGSRNRNRNVLGDGLAAMLLAESERLVADPCGVTGEMIPVKQAVVRSALRRACDGKGLKVVLDALAGSEAQLRKRQRDVLQGVEDYIERTREEIATCKANGMDPPDLFPHPDEIIVNHEAGTVLILGACETRQKMLLHAHCSTRRRQSLAEIEALTKLLGQRRFAPYGEHLIEEIEAEREIVEMSDRWLGFLNPRRRRRLSTPDPKPTTDAETGPVEEVAAEPSPRRVRPKLNACQPPHRLPTDD